MAKTSANLKETPKESGGGLGVDYEAGAFFVYLCTYPNLDLEHTG